MRDTLTKSPQKHVPGDFVETDVPFPAIDRYIGEEKGIQGHQNSRYVPGRHINRPLLFYYGV